MSRIVRLLKLSKEKSSLKDEELQMKCSKCGKRPATDPGGLCKSCRFDEILAQVNESK